MARTVALQLAWAEGRSNGYAFAILPMKSLTQEIASSTVDAMDLALRIVANAA